MYAKRFEFGEEKHHLNSSTSFKKALAKNIEREKK